MQLLAFKDPTGRVTMLHEAQALPPLADGFEWTMVLQAESEEEAEPEPAPPQRRQKAPSRPRWHDVLLPLLTPQPGQTPKERAQELVDALPPALRSQLGQVVRAFRRPELPPFPRG